MSLYNFNLPESIINSLGWTIIHSLWQICIVALFLGIILLFIRKRSASLKYYVSAGSLLIILIFSVITFCNEYSHYRSTTEQGSTMINARVELQVNNGQEKHLALLEQLRQLVDRNLPIIVVIWNICVFMLFVKFIGGLLYSQRLRWHGISKMPDKWIEMVNQMSKSLKINKAIRLLESAVAETPIVIGYLKPVILLPIGIITGLSPEEAEAIIMHELAHIKRNDYLINIFISIIEVLFFFHPAIWWISNRLKIERENACDDLAVSKLINRNTLAKALARLELMRHPQEHHALAFIGNKGSLIKRIRRMKTTGRTKFTFTEGLITISFLIVCAIIMSFSSGTFGNRMNKIIGKRLNSAITDLEKNPAALSKTENDAKDTIITFNPGNKVVYQVNGNKYNLSFDDKFNLLNLYVNNKEIPKNEWNKYEGIIKDVVEVKKKNTGQFEKQAIVEELIKEMKKDKLIDENAISYKVYFFDNYMEINDVKQPDKVFEKYKKLFDEKSKGKYKLDLKLNVNPNLYGKSPEEVNKKQEQFAQQEKQKEKEIQLKKEQEKQYLEQIKIKEEQEKLKQAHSELSEEQQKNLQEQEDILKKQEVIVKEHELQLKKLEQERYEMKNGEKKYSDDQLKKKEEEIKAKEEQLQKLNQELQIKYKDLQKKYEELKKKNEQLKKENK